MNEIENEGIYKISFPLAYKLLVTGIMLFGCFIIFKIMTTESFNLLTNITILTISLLLLKIGQSVLVYGIEVNTINKTLTLSRTLKKEIITKSQISDIQIFKVLPGGSSQVFGYYTLLYKTTSNKTFYYPLYYPINNPKKIINNLSKFSGIEFNKITYPNLMKDLYLNFRNVFI